MTDEERIRLATRLGNKMFGPVECQRCRHHPCRWVSYRWTWAVGTTPDVGEIAALRGCGSCEDEETQ